MTASTRVRITTRRQRMARLGPASPLPMLAPPPQSPFRIEPPIPLELHAFGLASTLVRIGSEVGEVSTRPDTPPSPDGGVIADYRGAVGDPEALAAALAGVPGVVDHGVFPAEMVTDVLIGRGDSVERA